MEIVRTYAKDQDQQAAHSFLMVSRRWLSDVASSNFHVSVPSFFHMLRWQVIAAGLR